MRYYRSNGRERREAKDPSKYANIGKIRAYVCKRHGVVEEGRYARSFSAPTAVRRNPATETGTGSCCGISDAGVDAGHARGGTRADACCACSGAAAVLIDVNQDVF